MERGIVYTLEFIGYDSDEEITDTLAFTYYHCASDPSTFYCPYQPQGMPDYFFHYYGVEKNAGGDPSEIRVIHQERWDSTQSNFFSTFTFSPGFPWLLPYDVLGTTNRPGDYSFLTPQQPHIYETDDLALSENLSWTWAPEVPVELRFQPGSRLRVEDPLSVSGMTFTALDPALDWGGIDVSSTGAFEAAGDLTLRGGTHTFAAGKRLTVDGDLTAEAAIFTERAAGQGWGGLDVGASGSFHASGGTTTLEEAASHEINGALVVDAGGDLFTDGGTFAFAAGKNLIVDGDFTAEDATFTERTTGQGWAGIAVYEGASLDLDNVVVEEAGVGVFVASTDVTISNSDFLRNMRGVQSGYVQDYCFPTACAVGNNRSQFQLLNSRVMSSVNANDVITEGVGVAARNADAEITGTAIDANEGIGLVVWNADIETFLDNKVIDNDSMGVYLLGNGHLEMTEPTLGLPGEDCVARNDGDEINLSAGYLFLGNDNVGGDNAVFDGTPETGSFLIRRTGNFTVEDVIDARQTYWGTGGAPPSGAFPSGANIDAANPLSTNPADCIGEAGVPRLASVGTSHAARGASPTPIGSDPNPSEMQWLREEIRSHRAALQQAILTESDRTASMVQALYESQRLDRADVLGEHTATMTRLAAIRTLLIGGTTLSTAIQDAAEAALVAEVADALRHGAYTEAEALVAAHEALVEGDEAGRSLSLHAAMADEAAGRPRAALARVEAVQAALLAEGRVGEAEGLLLVASELADQAGAERPSVVTGSVPAAQTLAASRGAKAFVLGAPYPNPSAGSVTVPVVLSERAEVRVAVYDVLGREVAVLADEAVEVGTHRFAFDAAALPSGVYLVRATLSGPASSGQAYTERITLVN